VKQFARPFIAVLVLAVALIVATAAPALSYPTKTGACSTCHGRYSMTLTAKVVSKKSGYTTYRVSAPKATAWAVLSGGRNYAHGTGTSGTFRVPTGRTYKVWAVRLGKGAASRSLTVKR
jgi:hypothetical protein